MLAIRSLKTACEEYITAKPAAPTDSTECVMTFRLKSLRNMMNSLIIDDFCNFHQFSSGI